ncbi:MAG: SpoIIIAH-like family protein [Lachnospiraceae bacterium]|nr:SpoIIIAH-like family protein [Lachnospiraceae bacterium]
MKAKQPLKKPVIKKPVFKKNQIIITALAAMIAVAGYLNYSGASLDASLLSANSEAVEEDTDLALDISAEDSYAASGETDIADLEGEYTEEIASLDEDYESSAAAETDNDVETASAGETVLVTGTVGVGIVSEAKVTREQTRSKNKEILMELIESTSVTDEQKQSAIEAMVSMTDVAERELAAETLLMAQGFDEAVVSITDNSADVVVSSTQVSDAERAQIEDIVKRKTGIEAANITITPVTSE